MQITRNGHETGRGLADWLTGDVHIDTIASPSAATRFMAHIAIQQADDEGNVATWGEHISDEQYGQAPSLTEGGN